ncbi:hypothetical protein ACFVHW_07995 [Streptomyces sp. NPDC127110]|uniref:hypothetical protein n=1 Tax=Streptomyces sp. NPDC127110 TaxID=3345362 RepID=UPI0036329018
MLNRSLAGEAVHLALTAAEWSAGLVVGLLDLPRTSGPVPPAPGIGPSAVGPAEYEAIAGHLAPLDALVDAAPAAADADGMRWRHLDETVLFSCTREVDVAFEEFTARVDIARVISMTSGYLGGRTAVAERDRAGRAVRQVERSVNRAQPAYLALSGAPLLDVCKAETIDYRPDGQVLRWRQVHSPNGSALQDDGSVSFARTDRGTTRITVRAYQCIALPALWRAVGPVLWPVVRRTLVEDAYRRSFTDTLDTIEARARGTEPSPGPARPHGVDAAGFRHFGPGR